jgi:hypothetical protein
MNELAEEVKRSLGVGLWLRKRGNFVFSMCGFVNSIIACRVGLDVGCLILYFSCLTNLVPLGIQKWNLNTLGQNTF